MLLATLVRLGLTDRLDRALLGSIPPPAAEWTTRLAEGLATAGHWQVQGGVLILLGLYAGWARGDLRPAYLSAAALLLLGAGCLLLKHAIGRVGPHDLHHGLVEGTAFPSGHAAGALLLGVLGAHLAGRGASRAGRIVLLGLGGAWALAVGWSRLRLEVHWLSDVVGGWLLGGTVVAVALLVIRSDVLAAAHRGKLPASLGRTAKKTSPPVDQTPEPTH